MKNEKKNYRMNTLYTCTLSRAITNVIISNEAASVMKKLFFWGGGLDCPIAVRTIKIMTTCTGDRLLPKPNVIIGVANLKKHPFLVNCETAFNRLIPKRRRS